MLMVIPGSVPTYAPGKDTPAGVALPPPVTLICTQDLSRKSVSTSQVIHHKNPTEISGGGNLHVKLCSRIRAGHMQSDRLSPEKILSARDALGNVELQ